MSCSGISMEEAHQVAYLTMHGWSLIAGDWLKDGFVRTYEKSHLCGCCTKTETSRYFSLETAYSAQLEASSG